MTVSLQIGLQLLMLMILLRANRLRQVAQSQVLNLQSNILKLRVSQYHGQHQIKAMAQLPFM